MRLHPLCGVGLFVALTACVPADRAAASVFINFDTFPGGAPVPNNTVITTQYASVGVRFTSTTPGGGPVADSSAEASSGPNFLVGMPPGGSLGNRPIDMYFTATLAATVDVTLVSVGTGTVTATAYASDLMTILDSISVTHGLSAGNGFGNHDPITLTGSGIALVHFAITQNTAPPDGFGIDDVEFTVVPAPGAAAMLAAVGVFALRRKR